MNIQISDILLAAILLFVVLIWLRDNPQYVWVKRNVRLFKKWNKRLFWRAWHR